jgi:predicted membrane protein
MNKDYPTRLGNFFLLVGIAILFLFLASVFANEFNLTFLLLAVAALFLGFMLRNMVPPPEPTRFFGIRKVSQRSRQRREEKEKNRKKDLWQE